MVVVQESNGAMNLNTTTASKYCDSVKPSLKQWLLTNVVDLTVVHSRRCFSDGFKRSVLPKSTTASKTVDALVKNGRWLPNDDLTVVDC